MTDAPRTYDKSNWPPGPWDTEPDRVEFEHTGLPCLALRSFMGNWCGYAAVPPGHPLHGKHYNDDAINLDVHGGLTYSGACDGDICHVPKPGEPDDVHWFGFDCGHYQDTVPGMLANNASSLFGDTTYKNLAYVTHEIQRLAEQLAELLAEVR